MLRISTDGKVLTIEPLVEKDVPISSEDEENKGKKRERSITEVINKYAEAFQELADE